MPLSSSRRGRSSGQTVSCTPQNRRDTTLTRQNSTHNSESHRDTLEVPLSRTNSGRHLSHSPSNSSLGSSAPSSDHDNYDVFSSDGNTEPTQRRRDRSITKYNDDRIRGALYILKRMIEDWAKYEEPFPKPLIFRSKVDALWSASCGQVGDINGTLELTKDIISQV